jgi:hypothetical protein
MHRPVTAARQSFSFFGVGGGGGVGGVLLPLDPPERHSGQLAYNFVICTANIFLLNSSFFRRQEEANLVWRHHLNNYSRM